MRAKIEIAAVAALVHLDGLEHCARYAILCRGIPMPHKHNDDRRHHIPKMAFKVQNWPEYEAGRRRRGSLTLWIEMRRWTTGKPLDRKARPAIPTLRSRPR